MQPFKMPNNGKTPIKKAFFPAPKFRFVIWQGLIKIHGQVLGEALKLVTAVLRMAGIVLFM
jgi:Ni,Fe-hydrogenase III small subunit